MAASTLYREQVVEATDSLMDDCQLGTACRNCNHLTTSHWFAAGDVSLFFRARSVALPVDMLQTIVTESPIRAESKLPAIAPPEGR